MPTRKTITRAEAGVFLPGDPVECEAGWGVVIWPTAQMEAWPHTDTQVPVKWVDGSLIWREPKQLKRRR